MAYKLHERDLRGTTTTGWLDGRHTFSFGGFRDPERMGFGPLRVINDDTIIPGGGFATHPHDNMEIITYVLEGALEHKDSMGNGSIIKPGEIQKMSAGSGVTHSEFNPSNDNKTHLLQIWIIPNKRDIKPEYQQITVNADQARKGFVLVGAPQTPPGGITIHQDAKMLIARPRAGQTLSYDFQSGRRGFLHVARGLIAVEGEILKAGDGLEISAVQTLKIQTDEDSELILFDMA